MSMFDVPTVTRQTLRESASSQLRNSIVSGGIKAGTHLLEIELSDSLGISRGTLREALRSLQQEGLLVQDSRGRVSVRMLSPLEVEQLFEVRTALETIALTRLCRLPDRHLVVSELLSSLEDLRSKQGSLEDGLQADMRFHETMCRLSGSSVLLDSWCALSGLVQLAMIAAGIGPARANMRADRHAPFIDFIKNGDSDGGSVFLKDHMESALEMLLTSMRSKSPD